MKTSYLANNLKRKQRQLFGWVLIKKKHRIVSTNKQNRTEYKLDINVPVAMKHKNKKKIFFLYHIHNSIINDNCIN